jgi:hypothetical protein
MRRKLTIEERALNYLGQNQLEKMGIGCILLGTVPRHTKGSYSNFKVSMLHEIQQNILNPICVFY